MKAALLSILILISFSSSGFSADPTGATAGSSAPTTAPLPTTNPYPNPGLPMPLQWSDSQNFVNCGQRCTYGHAVTDLALLNTYNLEMMDYVKNMDIGTNDKHGKDYDDAKHIFGKICPDGKEMDQCRNEYLLMLGKVTREGAYAEAKTHADASKLSSRKPGNPSFGTGQPIYTLQLSAGADHYEAGLDPKQPLKRPQLPYIATFEDLDKEYKKLKALTAPEYEDWEKKVMLPEPSKNDFAKSYHIQGDPKDPSSGNGTVIAVMPNGEPVYDVVKYEKAVNEWRKHQQEVQKDLDKMIGDYKSDKTKIPMPKQGLDMEVSSKQREIYNSARETVVNTINKEISARGIVTQVTYPSSQAPTLSSRATLSRSQGGTMPSRSPAGADSQVIQPAPTVGNQGASIDVGWDHGTLEQEIDKLLPP